MTRIPPSYLPLELNRATGYVLLSEAKPLSAALTDGTGCLVDTARGRGQVSRCPLNSGEAIIRRYRRGGLIARLVRDGFLGNRMLAEFNVLRALHERGFPVPEPLGVLWERSGPVYRGKIATRRLAASTLLEWLGERGDARPVLLRCGQRIREMHDLGVWHADLQVKNILTDGREVWIIDFDRARLRPRLSPLARSRNLLRLRRSLEKNHLTLDNFDCIREGYGDLGISPWLSALYRLRGTVTDFLRK